MYKSLDKMYKIFENKSIKRVKEYIDTYLKEEDELFRELLKIWLDPFMALPVSMDVINISFGKARDIKRPSARGKSRTEKFIKLCHEAMTNCIDFEAREELIRFILTECSSEEAKTMLRITGNLKFGTNSLIEVRRGVKEEIGLIDIGRIDRLFWASNEYYTREDFKNQVLVDLGKGSLEMENGARHRPVSIKIDYSGNMVMVSSVYRSFGITDLILGEPLQELQKLVKTKSILQNSIIKVIKSPTKDNFVIYDWSPVDDLEKDTNYLDRAFRLELELSDMDKYEFWNVAKVYPLKTVRDFYNFAKSREVAEHTDSNYILMPEHTSFIPLKGKYYREGRSPSFIPSDMFKFFFAEIKTEYSEVEMEEHEEGGKTVLKPYHFYRGVYYTGVKQTVYYGTCLREDDRNTIMLSGGVPKESLIESLILYRVPNESAPAIFLSLPKF